MNHAMIVAKIDKTEEIPGADKIHTAFIMGERVVVSKDWKQGMEGLFFPPELQLSHDFCHHNNLYRDKGLNKDQSKAGFFESNRRVRVQPFLKVKSEGFFCTKDSLSYLMSNTDKLKVGETYQDIQGTKICEKYISEGTKKKMAQESKNKVKKKVLATPMFNKHMDTDQFKYYAQNIKKGSLISIQHKIHGTSARYSLTKVVSTPVTLFEKLLDKVGLFKSEKWEYIAGTRNVTLFENQRDKEGFHGKEEYRFNILDSLKPYLEHGMTIYGEIAGYANGKPIMGIHSVETLKNKEYTKKYGKDMVYSYGCKEHELRFHVYRISITSPEGTEYDFTESQIQEWCEVRGLNPPLELCEQFVYDGDVEKLKALVEELTERPDNLCEDYIDPSHINEGVIVRVDAGSSRPKFYKNKSYAFRVCEGIFKEDNVDIEDAS